MATPKPCWGPRSRKYMMYYIYIYILLFVPAQGAENIWCIIIYIPLPTPWPGPPAAAQVGDSVDNWRSSRDQREYYVYYIYIYRIYIYIYVCVHRPEGRETRLRVLRPYIYIYIYIYIILYIYIMLLLRFSRPSGRSGGSRSDPGCRSAWRLLNNILILLFSLL